jgi:signal transduction histidine kinase
MRCCPRAILFRIFPGERRKWTVFVHALVLAALLVHLVSCNSGGESADCKISEMVTAVHCAAQGLGGINQGDRSDETTQDAIRWYVHSLSYLDDSSGYFFAINVNGLCIAHYAARNLVGQNIYDLQDSSGKYFVRDLIAAAQAGGGFVEYDCLNPATGAVEKKLSYAEMITGTGYLIGSGVYVP